MASRIVAAMGAVLLFALIAALSVPVLLGVPVPVAPSEDPSRPAAALEQQTSGGLLEAKLFLLPELGYRLDLFVSRDPGAPAPQSILPTVILEMEGMDMGRTEPPLTLIGIGEFRASGSFLMPGRWRFRLGFEDELFDLPVSVPASSSDPAPAPSPARSSFGHFATRREGAWL